jgi:hypothetical protein
LRLLQSAPVLTSAGALISVSGAGMTGTILAWVLSSIGFSNRATALPLPLPLNSGLISFGPFMVFDS